MFGRKVLPGPFWIRRTAGCHFFCAIVAVDTRRSHMCCVALRGRVSLRMLTNSSLARNAWALCNNGIRTAYKSVMKLTELLQVRSDLSKHIEKRYDCFTLRGAFAIERRTETCAGAIVNMYVAASLKWRSVCSVFRFVGQGPQCRQRGFENCWLSIIVELETVSSSYCALAKSAASNILTLGKVTLWMEGFSFRRDARENIAMDYITYWLELCLYGAPCLFYSISLVGDATICVALALRKLWIRPMLLFCPLKFCLYRGRLRPDRSLLSIYIVMVNSDCTVV